MAVEDFIDEALTKEQIVALVSLDVKGAFDAVWGRSVVKALKDFHCPETYTTSLRTTSQKGQHSKQQRVCEQRQRQTKFTPRGSAADRDIGTSNTIYY